MNKSDKDTQRMLVAAEAEIERMREVADRALAAIEKGDIELAARFLKGFCKPEGVHAQASSMDDIVALPTISEEAIQQLLESRRAIQEARRDKPS